MKEKYGNIVSTVYLVLTLVLLLFDVRDTMLFCVPALCILLFWIRPLPLKIGQK